MANGLSQAVGKNALIYIKSKIDALLAKKVDKEDGKGLSTNDYTTDEKTKLAGIDENANKTTINNTLTSSSTSEALSAAQGKELKSQIDAIEVPTVTNDLTDALKANYDAAYEHSQTAHAPSDAEANVIAQINVNGVAQAVTNKAVSITVPTTVVELSDASSYVKKTDLTSVYKYQGSVATTDDLPTSSTAGYVYNVEADGMNYAYTSDGSWDALGAIFEVEEITNAEIDEIFT